MKNSSNIEKQFSVNINEVTPKICLSRHLNGMTGFCMHANQFKEKDSELNIYLFC